MLSILDVPLLYSPKIDLLDLDSDLKTLKSEETDRELARNEFLTSPIYKDVILSADGTTTGLLATLTLDQTYLNLVTQRDDLRQIRDTIGLTKEQQTFLNAVSLEFLDYRTAKAKKDHQRISNIRSLILPYRDKATIYLGGPDMITADMIDFIKSDLVNFGVGIILSLIHI